MYTTHDSQQVTEGVHNCLTSLAAHGPTVPRRTARPSVWKTFNRKCTWLRNNIFFVRLTTPPRLQPEGKLPKSLPIRICMHVVLSRKHYSTSFFPQVCRWSKKSHNKIKCFKTIRIFYTKTTKRANISHAHLIIGFKSFLFYK